MKLPPGVEVEVNRQVYKGEIPDELAPAKYVKLQAEAGDEAKKPAPAKTAKAKTGKSEEDKPA